MLPDELPKDTELSARHVCLHRSCLGQRELVFACWTGARLLRLRLAPPVVSLLTSGAFRVHRSGQTAFVAEYRTFRRFTLLKGMSCLRAILAG
ncbi:hypothetical protein ACLKA6_016348 [Drosophila palustris]